MANGTIPLLVGFVADVITSPLPKSDTYNGSNDLFGSGRIDDGSIVRAEYSSEDELETNLLMPTWAYRLTAAYLIFISVLGLIMNIIVVIVILNDSQVIVNLYLIYCFCVILS